MSKSVLTTLATADYLPYAKQLFSSAYFKGGWEGDFLLLAFDIPPQDLSWFVDKGIIIYPCTRFLSFEPPQNHPSLLCRLLLLSPYFKKWDHVVSLDCDMLARASLDAFTTVDGFYAVPDAPFPKLKHQILTRGYPALEKDFRQSYNIDSLAFNAGAMAFSTDIISESGYADLIALANKYQTTSRFGDQGIFNLHLYKRWKPLNIVYNTFSFYIDNRPDIQLAVLHAPFVKPWGKDSPYFSEWQRNYDCADSIRIHTRAPGVVTLTPDQIRRSARQLKPLIVHYVYCKMFFKRLRNFLRRHTNRILKPSQQPR